MTRPSSGRFGRRGSEGIALPLVLAALLILGLLIMAIVAVILGPSTYIGRTARLRVDLVAAESRLEQARAVLFANPDFDLAGLGLDAEWVSENEDTLAIAATAGEVTVRETWTVFAPTRYVLFSDSGLIAVDTEFIEGLVRVGRDTSASRLSWRIDTLPFMPMIHRTLTEDALIGQTIRFEVVYLSAISDSVEIRLEDIAIDQGLLIVEGDARLSGRFAGTAREGWPLLVVTGRLSSDIHEALWQWKGLLAAGKSLFLNGPVEYEGTIVAETVELTGNVKGRHADSRSVAGFWPRIGRIDRTEAPR